MAEERVIELLRSFGYGACSVEGWDKAELPTLAFRVTDHAELHGHTFYHVPCVLQHQVSQIAWHTKLRLAHLRELRKVVKQIMGNASYLSLFPECKDNFALRGAPPGTTKRLDTWLKRIALSANQRKLPPIAVYRMLLFMQVPLPSTDARDVLCSRPTTGAASSAVVESAPADAFSIGDTESGSEMLDEDEDGADPPFWAQTDAAQVSGNQAEPEALMD
mmetsp:Transcript_47831/g.111569  ORF Transcript_47831/g.111569 Transcript_47831/m.111569 type:complete len:219 (+) Transcript_47831:122-778(+)